MGPAFSHARPMHAEREAVRREGAIQRHHAGLAFEPENFPGDGAGVLRVDVDRACLQRGEDDAGVAEPRLQLPGRGARQDFAQDVGLGEALGSDFEGLRRRRAAERRERERRREAHAQ